MTRNNQDTVPFNPFLTEADEEIANLDGFERLKIHAGDVPFSADGFDQMAEVVDWSPSEIQVLHDAAATIRWVCRNGEVTERQAIGHRMGLDQGLTLVFKRNSYSAGSKSLKDNFEGNHAIGANGRNEAADITELEKLQTDVVKDNIKRD